MQEIARAREAAGGVAPMQIGALNGNCVKDKGVCVQHWYLKDDNTMETVLSVAAINSNNKQLR